MANIARRAVGPNDAGIPEDEVRDIIIPLTLPPGTVLCDPKTGDRYDHEGKKLDRRISEQRGHMKTPHDLACAISALINSSPRSPTIAELEAVIGEHWKAPSGIAGLEALQGESLAINDDLREIKDGESNYRRLARVGLQTAEEKEQCRLAGLQNALIEALERRRIEDPAAFSRGEFVPPMVVVTDRTWDSICLGGVDYGI